MASRLCNDSYTTSRSNDFSSRFSPCSSFVSTTLCADNPPNWRPLLSIARIFQHRLPLSVGLFHPNAQGYRPGLHTYRFMGMGVAQPDAKTFGNIMIIVVGVAIASFGEIEFSVWGFIFQMCGTIAEAVRVVMIQVMLSAEGLRMDPLVGLYYYAPVCTLMNLVVVFFSEGPRFKWEDAATAGYGMLFANAFLAFILNVISVVLIGKTSGLVMTLSGILKSILLVAASVVIWSTHISLLQTLGYSIALMGLVLYSVGYEQLLDAWDGLVAWGTGVNREGEMSSALRKAIMVGCLGFITVVIAGALWHYHGLSGTQVARATTSWLGH
ncbi:hypothetical protein NXS19_009923 [Fusarium pseudograminearum]|nr:hypothetical protein NXS19_009923 [Fusarium pseudograminearum]